MSQRKREKIGPFVVTGHDNVELNLIICANCEKKLAEIDQDRFVPSCEQLLDAGAVAWPNFGWFCSAECEANYGREFGVWMERDAKFPPKVFAEPARQTWWNWLFGG
jgi:hypothetical protein